LFKKAFIERTLKPESKSIADNSERQRLKDNDAEDGPPEDKPAELRRGRSGRDAKHRFHARVLNSTTTVFATATVKPLDWKNIK